MKIAFILLLSLFVHTGSILAQDVITLSNGDTINGDIKNLDKGILEVETEYSDDNFTMNWESVINLKSSNNFLIILATGKRYYGSITVTDKQATITQEGTSEAVDLLEVVFIKSVNDRFWDKMSISIDGGYSLAKANENRQFTLTGNASYLSERINPDIYTNVVNGSTDDGTSKINTARSNYGGNFRMFFHKSWFGTAGADYLSSDEQSLNLRSTYTLGIGSFIISNYKMYLSAAVGGAWNREDYDSDDVTGTDSNTNSSESFVHLDYNAFGLDNVSITSQLKVFPSLSEERRVRLNYDLSVKFDLFKDFYLGTTYTLTYDSEPISSELASSDYVISTTLGWSL